MDSTLVLTGSADNSAKIWDCEYGKEIRSFSTSSSVRTCGFSHLGNLLMYSTDERRDVSCEILVYDVRSDESAVTKMNVEGEKVTAGVWGPFDEYIITGHGDGTVAHYDYQVSNLTLVVTITTDLILRLCKGDTTNVENSRFQMGLNLGSDLVLELYIWLMEPPTCSQSLVP